MANSDTLFFSISVFLSLLICVFIYLCIFGFKTQESDKTMRSLQCGSRANSLFDFEFLMKKNKTPNQTPLKHNFK